MAYKLSNPMSSSNFVDFNQLPTPRQGLVPRQNDHTDFVRPKP